VYNKGNVIKKRKGTTTGAIILLIYIAMHPEINSDAVEIIQCNTPKKILMKSYIPDPTSSA